MKRSGSRRPSLFLIELIIVLFFFMLVCAVCLRLFALADLTSRESKDLSISQNLAQSFAEALKGSDGSPQEMIRLLPELSYIGQQYRSWYDSSWQPCSSEDAVYSLDNRYTYSSLKTAALTIRDLRREKDLFQLELTFYHQTGKEISLYEEKNKTHHFYRDFLYSSDLSFSLPADFCNPLSSQCPGRP